MADEVEGAADAVDCGCVCLTGTGGGWEDVA